MRLLAFRYLSPDLPPYDVLFPNAALPDQDINLSISPLPTTHKHGSSPALPSSDAPSLPPAHPRGVALIATGIVLGLALAAFLARAMTRRLRGVIEASPMPFLSVTVFLAAVALLASYIPARRTLRHDPTRALRHE